MTAESHGPNPAMRYRAYGSILSSTVPLQELAQTQLSDSSETTNLHIIFPPFGEPLPTSEPSDWYLTVSLADGTAWMRCAKVSTMYLIHFPNCAHFVFNPLTSSIHCMPEADIPPHTVNHLLLDQVLPLVLNHKGKEVLHGSAVATPYGACAFVGQTGAGKSTLAASFLSAGYSVLTDDCVVLDICDEHIVAIPAYPSLRLWDDAVTALFGITGAGTPVAHYTSKQRFMDVQTLKSFCTSPIPLTRIYVLGTNESDPPLSSPTPEISFLTEREALMALLPLAFKLDILDQQRLARELDFLHRLVSQTHIRRLAIPDSLAALSEVRTAVLLDLAQSC